MFRLGSHVRAGVLNEYAPHQSIKIIIKKLKLKKIESYFNSQIIAPKNLLSYITFMSS